MNNIKKYISGIINKIILSKNLKLYLFFIFALILLICLIIAIFSVDEKSNNDLIEENSSYSYALDPKASSNINTPTLLDNESTKNLTNDLAAPKEYALDSKALNEPSIQVMPPQTQNITTNKTEDLSMQDRDMKTYLKSIQSQIVINNDSFTYENKTFRVGEKFDGYLIEKITPIFIRFADDKTALHYNLRFIIKDNK